MKIGVDWGGTKIEAISIDSVTGKEINRIRIDSPKDDYEKINLSGKDLDNDPQALNDITRTVSMFFNNKVIIADSIKDKHLNIIEENIINAPQQVFLILLNLNQLMY